MELWDLYDKNRQLLNRTHIRGNEIPPDCYHLVVHVWIRNSKGEYLISKRAADRPTFPLMWECVGGSVLKGESSLEGALRETKEEAGVELDASKGKVLFSKIRGVIDGRNFQDIMDVWLFEYNGEINLEWATTKEVCELRWMTPDEIRKLYEGGVFVDTLDYFFCIMDAPEPDYKDIIGKKVRGKIDRPLGSKHPKCENICYPVNYGYVEGMPGGDGEEQDVYFLGVDKPVETFEGKVIAVFHRYNDTEDKWIVAPDGMAFTDEQILGEISFQEQYFYGKLYR